MTELEEALLKECEEYKLQIKTLKMKNFEFVHKFIGVSAEWMSWVVGRDLRLKRFYAEKLREEILRIVSEVDKIKYVEVK